MDWVIKPGGVANQCETQTAPLWLYDELASLIRGFSFIALHDVKYETVSDRRFVYWLHWYGSTNSNL